MLLNAILFGLMFLMCSSTPFQPDKSFYDLAEREVGEENIFFPNERIKRQTNTNRDRDDPNPPPRSPADSDQQGFAAEEVTLGNTIVEDSPISATTDRPSSAESPEANRNKMETTNPTLSPNDIIQINPTIKSLKPKFTIQNKEEENIPTNNFPLQPTNLPTGELATYRPKFPFSGTPSSSSLINEEAQCNFGTADKVQLCKWMNHNNSMEKWTASKGMSYSWLGGPPKDKTNEDVIGGYAMYETSKILDNQFPQVLTFDSAMLMSPVLRKSEAIGSCIDFWYALDGLSQDRLRIILRPPPVLNFASRHNRNLTDEDLMRYFFNSDGADDIVLWEYSDSTNGKWINGQAVYTFNDRHMIIFEGIPVSLNDPNRLYRGYISIDDVNFMEASQCKPFCNFEGGICSWSQDKDDDFDWSLSRGSINPSTGPPMDRFSSRYGIKGGGYAFIDSGYPRRPQDRARLLSEAFGAPGPDSPYCMRFWTHMFGNGIGSLRILLVPTRGEEEVIWELKGEQGNTWYQGQVTIASAADFQIVIEAEIGDNNLGDIAIDEISLRENACPTSPQSASKVPGDCTFEVDGCSWRNVELRQRMDELDWERVTAAEARTPSSDHTLKTNQGSYMSLPRTAVQRGQRGWLMSPRIEPFRTKSSLCISFWYFMNDPFIEQGGPSLGLLKVILVEEDPDGRQKFTPLWELKNHQGPTWQYGQTSISTTKTFLVIFEGLWGNSRGSENIALDDITFFTGKCKTMPEKAKASVLSCDFTRDSCSYLNGSSGTNDRWLPSSISRKPSTLSDHTYGGPVGYLYFDVFNTNNDPPRVILMSSVIKGDNGNLPACLTFWYAAIGNDPDTRLTINKDSADASANEPETPNTAALTLLTIPASKVFKDRIEWMFGQVQYSTATDYKLSFVGQAKKGGFAIDDIQVFPGTCKTRPRLN